MSCRFREFWVPVSWNLNWTFSELLELSLGRCGHSCPGCCVHMYIVAGFLDSLSTVGF